MGIPRGAHRGIFGDDADDEEGGNPWQSDPSVTRTPATHVDDKGQAQDLGSPDDGSDHEARMAAINALSSSIGDGSDGDPGSQSAGRDEAGIGSDKWGQDMIDLLKSKRASKKGGGGGSGFSQMMGGGGGGGGMGGMSSMGGGGMGGMGGGGGG